MLHCVPFITYQETKGSENATEIWKYDSLAYGTVIKILKRGKLLFPPLHRYLYTAVPIASGLHKHPTFTSQTIHKNRKQWPLIPWKRYEDGTDNCFEKNPPSQKKKVTGLLFFYSPLISIRGLSKTNICHGQHQIMKNSPLLPPILPKFKPTATQGVQRPVVHYDYLGAHRFQNQSGTIFIVCNGTENITLHDWKVFSNNRWQNDVSLSFQVTKEYVTHIHCLNYRDSKVSIPTKKNFFS